jgi:toxin ParE1/3/4
MKTGRIRRRPEAIEDLFAQGTYYVEQGAPETAARFLAAADATFKLLSGRPNLGHRWESSHPRLQGVRVWHVKGFDKHLVFYRPVKGGVEILHVFHGAQDIPTILATESDEHE